MLVDVPVRLGAVVDSVRTGADGVALTLRDGEIAMARAAIFATGLNPLAGIAFDPPLPAPKAEAIRLGHLGRAVKVWIRARGIAPGTLATGGGHGIEFLFAERLAADGDTLLVGFGVAGADWTPDFPGDARAALDRFFPEAEFVAADWHDWNADPFARGTWVAGIVGAADAHAYGTWHRHGRLAFASSDIAPEAAGWFEAAAISGEAAAAAIVEALAAG
jgi:monoamine oxidase